MASQLNGVTGPITVLVDGGCPRRLRVTVAGADDMADAGALERHPDGVTLHLPYRLPVASTSGAAR